MFYSIKLTAFLKVTFLFHLTLAVLLFSVAEVAGCTELTQVTRCVVEASCTVAGHSVTRGGVCRVDVSRAITRLTEVTCQHTTPNKYP